jgi:alpha-beta hydrolase superfamily lysophospholipase
MRLRYQILDAQRPVTEDNQVMSRPNDSGSKAAPLAPPANRGPGGTLRTEGYLKRGRLRLYHCDWLPEAPRPQGSALVVLMHGYGEHCRRYDELAEYLATRGHGVFQLDARGHGRSGGQRGHIGDYSEYVGDLQAFVAEVALRYPQRARFLLGHSNGGLVAIRAVQLGLVGLHGLVLSSPLLDLQPRRKPVPEAVARWLSWALGRLPLPNGIHARDLTHDEAIKDAHASDRWVQRWATPRWYWSMIETGRLALADAASVSLPLLAVTGELDPIVDTARVSEFCARAGSRDKRLVIRPGAFHEVLNELDRRELFALIADWIERVMAEPAVPH